MKKKKRIPRRGLRLILALVLLVCLGFFGWIAEGCPAFSRAGAFRRAVRSAALPKAKLDVVLEGDRSDDPDVAIGVSDGGALTVLLRKPDNGHGWYGWNAQEYPSVDGVRYVLMNGTNYAGIGSFPDEPDDFRNLAAVAVKTDGARADLHLVLENVTFDPVGNQGLFFDNKGAVGGTWPMRELETTGNWTVYAFDTELFPDGIRILYSSDYTDVFLLPYDGNKSYWDAFYWILSFFGNWKGMDRMYTQPARFELTLYDEAGSVTKTVTWKP